MSRRKYIIADNHIYHVYNRSVGNEDILDYKKNLYRFLEIIEYYRLPQRIRYSKYKTLPHVVKKDYDINLKKSSPLVDIYAYALMPNHYHLLLKQLQDNGINKLVSNCQNSFAKYYNKKNERHGALFQNSFKARTIETDEDFMHVSRYIHLNPITSLLLKQDELKNSPLTSLPCYLDNRLNNFINTSNLIDMFVSREKYYRFVIDQADYQKKVGMIKRYLFD